MKIKPDQLSKHLSNGLEPLYFVFGPEILLVEESLALIKEAAKENSFSDSDSDEVDHFDISDPSQLLKLNIRVCLLMQGNLLKIIFQRICTTIH